MTTHTAKNLQFQHPEDMGKYRVVETCNFDSDYPDEKWASPVLHKKQAEKVAAIFNAAVPNTFDRFWKVVQLPYKLVPGFEP